MFVASQPSDGAELNIGEEIGMFQSNLLSRSLPNLEVSFCSDLSIDQFRSSIASFRPDIIHLSAHADYGLLRLRNANKDVVQLTMSQLLSLIPASLQPKLLVLSACDSDKLCDEESSQKIAMCLCFSGRVLHRVACSVTLTFYDQLLNGCELGEAFDCARDLLRLEHPSKVDLTWKGMDSSWKSRVLYRPPLIVARPVRLNARHTGEIGMRSEDIEIGLDGVPSDVVQLVFFTDERMRCQDGDYHQDQATIELENWRASKMARIVFGPGSSGGCLWSSSMLKVSVDERLHVVAIRGAGTSFVVSGSICVGLENAIERDFVPTDCLEMVRTMADAFRRNARSFSQFLE